MSETSLNLYKYVPTFFRSDDGTEELNGSIVLASDEKQAAELLSDSQQVYVWPSDMKMMYKHSASILYTPDKDN